MELFAQATRNKLRFASVKGDITTEDLWSLTLVALDKIAAELYTQLQTVNVSFLKSNRNKTNELLQLKLDVVRFIIAIKEQELEDKEAEQKRKERKEFLLDLKKKKEEEQYLSLSLEDINKQIDSM